MKHWLRRHEQTIRWASLGLIAASLVVLARVLPLERWIEVLRERIEALGAWGPPAFALVYALAVVAMVPGSILTLAAGALFGVWLGSVVVSLAATAGATLAFLVARHLARERVERAAQRHPRFAAVDAAIEEEGAKAIALLRLSPLLPFSLSNYLYGLTGVGLGAYVLATWLGTLPGTVMYVTLGHVGGASVAGDGRSTIEWVLLGGGLVATVVASLVLARVARRKLRERATDDRAEAAADAGHGESGEREARSLGGTLALAGGALALAAFSASCAIRPGWVGFLGAAPALGSRARHGRRADGPEEERRESRTFTIAGRERTLFEMDDDELLAAVVEPRGDWSLNSVRNRPNAEQER